ncbi:MAG: SCO1664 family protein [Anaerolineales bacterium]
MPASETLRQAFALGALELHGQFMLGSNYTFLVRIRHEGQVFQGVYKPKRGEQPLWDFPENSLAHREVAAYLVSEALGFGIVPYTTLREDGPYGPGSLQQYIEYNPNYHYFNFTEEDKARLSIVALFDHLTNNADRKGSHVFFEKRTRHLYAIDHGLCFHEEDKLRTVIWDFAGQPLPEEYLLALGDLRQALATGSLRTDLLDHLSAEEVDALDARAQALIAGGIFPLPPVGRRAFPYPPL